MKFIVDTDNVTWRRDEVEEVGLLVDAEVYYRQFYRAALAAKRSILLAGWQFDSDVALLRGEDAEKAPGPVSLIKFLNYLCEQRPELQIRILAWDFHVVFAAEREWMQKLEIKARSPEQEVQHLSGGNQQKVALARAMHQDADVLLLDEPTRGIDVGTKSTIYRLIGELAAAGKAVLFVSSYFPELLHVCDRVGVMARGHLREIRPANQWSEETMLACAIAAQGNDA